MTSEELLMAAREEFARVIERYFDGKPAIAASIPARPDRDFDLLISKALDVALACLRSDKARITEMQKAAQKWAMYAFVHHGDDAVLYNGLATLGGVNDEGVGWIPSDSTVDHEGPR